MDHFDITEQPVPQPADFIGSPFRMLPRVGDKLYRPARQQTDELPPMPPTIGRPCGPGVWDWG